MKRFSELYGLVVLTESGVVLSSPKNSANMEQFERIKKFVTENKVEPISEILSKLTEDKIKKTNLKKEDIDKLINIARKPIMGMSGMTVNDLFSPTNFVANLYNITNNADYDKETYMEVAEAFKTFNTDKSADSLANLIILVNLSSNQNTFATSIFRGISSGILMVIPGTGIAASMMVGSFATAAPNMLPLVNDFDSIGNNYQTIQSSGVQPGQILQTTVSESVKKYIVGSVVGASVVQKGAEAVKTISDTKDKVENKVKDTIKQIQDYSNKGDNSLFKRNFERVPTGNPNVQLRGKIGARGPAQY